MTLLKRKSIIDKIQKKRKSFVISYVVGDRANLSFQIGGDTPRLFYDHLIQMEEKVPRLDLFLYSIGGDTSIPWRIVSLFRECCEEFNVIIPYRAYSAATLLSLGADEIIMGKKGELGPIDPKVANEFNPLDPISNNRLVPINVEDVYSYFSLIKEKMGLVHQSEIGAALNVLANKVHPLSLGYVNRHWSFIRMIATKMIKTHMNPPSDSKIDEIVKALVEKIYFHGHGISRSEARELGLNVKDANNDLEKLMWNLYLEYEKELDLDTVFNPQDELNLVDSDEHIIRDVQGAFIESEQCSHIFKLDVGIRARRQTPQTLNLSMNLQVPPVEQGGQLTQQQLAQLQQTLQRIVQDEIRVQSPVIGIDTKMNRMRWEKC